MTQVKQREMSVYIAGQGDCTLVFLPGGGIVSPILDFKALTSDLTSEFKVVIIEKFGYGFSNEIDEARDVDSLVEEARQAKNPPGI